MTDTTTGAMQEFGDLKRPEGPKAGVVGGLVLLYAEGFQALPSAWPLTRRRCVIGRDDAADLTLCVRAVSRTHAEIVWEAGRFLIRDLGSRNGTIVDGQRVSEAELEPTQEIRIGDALLKFVDQKADQYAAYRIDGSMEHGASRRCRTTTTLLGGYQMDRIASEIERIAPTELTVMLFGESGTGKEVVASELHRMSGRPGSFCAVNCAAIPAQLIESELFGFKRGAFSGANRDKPGLFKTAHNGTLLLDEIGDMPPEAQAKLLRVLQAKEVFPIGATAPEPVNVRVVCATHRDLGKLQAAGTFRKDLFARLNEYQLRLPPLRERKEDIYLLSRAFLNAQGRPDLSLSLPLMVGLLHYEWPYNVRELLACIKRCVALAETNVLGEECLPESIRDAMKDYGRPVGASVGVASSAAQFSPALQVGTPVPMSPAMAERPLVPSEEQLRQLLESYAGNVAAVGRTLGKARMQVHRWMKRYGIDVDEYRRQT